MIYVNFMKGLGKKRIRKLQHFGAGLIFTNLNHLTVVSNVGSSLIRGTCETSQVLLASMPCVFFFRGSPVFALPNDWPVSYELK